MKYIMALFALLLIHTSAIADDSDVFAYDVCEFQNISTVNGLKRVKITIKPADSKKSYTELQKARTVYNAMDYFNKTEEFRDYVLINVLMFKDCTYKNLLSRAQIGNGERICTVYSKHGFKDMYDKVVKNTEE